MKSFANQAAIVTGASSGIGRAITLALAEQGASLYLVGRHEQRLEECATEVRKKDVAVQKVLMDLNDDEAIRKFVSSMRENRSALNVLVHSSGAFRKGKIEDAPVDELDYQYRINLRAPYMLTQGMLPLLKKSKGQIVFINSTQGLDAGESVGQFAATQHALKADRKSVV